MMLTRLDRPAEGRLTDDEIATLCAAGAERIVVEEVDLGKTTAIGVFMKRDRDRFWMARFKAPLEWYPADLRAVVIEKARARVAEIHASIPDDIVNEEIHQ